MVDKKDFTDFINDNEWPIAFVVSEKFNLFINSIPDAVIISNVAGEIININNTAAQLFGYPQEEFHHLKIENLVPEDVRSYHKELRSEFFDRPCPRHINTRLSNSLRAVNKNNEEFPIESSLFSINSDQGPLAINILRDISERKIAEEKLEKQAFFDNLTTLPNRQYFNDILQRSFARSQRGKTLLAVLFIDLDKFKQINDTYGHIIGDKTLAEAARRMQSVMRAGDFIARLGGDEFSCILYSLNNTDEAISIAKRIIAQCAEIFTIENIKFHINASVGIAFNTENVTNYKELLKNADTAMYKAKEQGGNCCAKMD
jgi:diguanylate cyclase (GGDEF)-like protein/PAS domain S-box-containing protein